MHLLDTIFNITKRRNERKEKMVRDFFEWMDLALSSAIQPEVVAFSINIFKDRRRIQLQLVGAPTFVEAKSDWAYDEMFSTGVYYLDIPKKICGKTPEEGQAFVKEMALQYLKTGTYRRVLKSRVAVALGYVEEPLEILFRKSRAKKYNE